MKKYKPFPLTMNKKEFANNMRRIPTKSESLMYNALLIAFHPYKATVYCQEVIGPYIADFFIAPSNIVLEVDGSIHNSEEQRKYDKSRDTFMRKRGIQVVRVTNMQVKENAALIAENLVIMSGTLKRKEEEVKITYCPPARASNWNRKNDRLNKYI